MKIVLSRSVMVGDKRDDMLAAEAAGVPTCILVRTGKKVTDEAIAAATVVLDSIADAGVAKLVTSPYKLVMKSLSD